MAVAASGTGDRVQTSPDNGITWTIRTSAADYQWRSVTYGAGVFVAVAFDGDPKQVQTSSDGGVTWASQTNAAFNQWLGVTFGAGVFVAVGAAGSVNTKVMTSGP